MYPSSIGEGPQYLHNAGNEAAWTLKVALTVILGESPDFSQLPPSVERIIAIDFENARNKDITEIGVAIIDTATLQHLAPGDDPMDASMVRHCVILGHSFYAAEGSVRWAPKDVNSCSFFNFGPSGSTRMPMSKLLNHQSGQQPLDHLCSPDSEFISKEDAGAWMRDLLRLRGAPTSLPVKDWRNAGDHEDIPGDIVERSALLDHCVKEHRFLCEWDQYLWEWVPQVISPRNVQRCGQGAMKSANKRAAAENAQVLNDIYGESDRHIIGEFIESLH